MDADSLYAPHGEPGHFFNPWAPFNTTFLQVMRWQLGKNEYDKKTRPRVRVVANDGGYLKDRNQPPSITWVGHSTFAVQDGGDVFLTDPHFGARALVPRRITPPGIPLRAVPAEAFAVLSHNHYDHLDDRSIRALLQANPELVCYVPLGLKPWFERRGVRHVHELGWWDRHGFRDLEVHCVPAQHWSARTPFDRNRTLWCGWVVKGHGLNFYFSGDTGYSPRLREIGDRLGPPDLAALPIGAYAPRWFMRPQHVDPPEAVQLHRELGARRSLAVHWGTFELADDGLDEPERLLREALRQSDLGVEDFWIIRQGESRPLSP